MRRKLGTAFVCLTICAVLSISLYRGTAAQTLPNHATYDQILERGEIHIAVYADFAPFSYRRDGRLVGVDMDIGRALAEKLGVEARFIELQADETVDDDLRNAIWKGHYLGGGIADVMMHVPVDRAFALRNNMVVIFGPYYQERLTLTRDRAKAGETPTLAVYRYEKIAVELDSLPDFYLTGVQGGMLRENVVHFLTVALAAAALRAGEVAAVFATRSQLEAALGEAFGSYDSSPVMMPGLSKESWTLGLAVSHTTRQLGYALEDIVTELVADGTVAAVFARHGLSYDAPASE